MRSSIMILAAFFLAACSTPDPGTDAPDAPPPGREASPVGGMCGGMMGTGCADPDAYCAYPAEAMCGAADQTGTCQIPPEVCTQQYQPVCGCDGQTYGNACTAAGSGVSVAYEGECRE